MFKDTRLTVGLIVVMVLAYFAEAAHPTNAMDYFYDYDAQNGPYYPFYSDGRFAGVLIREITGHIFAPTLYLMLGLMLLVASGMAVCAAFRVTDWKAVVLTCGLFATFPLILEIQSYHPLRITIPLAVFMSIASVISAENHKSLTGWMMGVGTLFIAFNLYQSITYIAILLTIYLAINQLLRGEKLCTTITRSILPRAAIYLIALILYLLFVKALQPYVVWKTVRLSAHALMFDRVLFPLVMMYIAVLLLALRVGNKWLSRYAYLSYFCIVAIFINQVNVWHEYMSIKNQSDYDATSKICAEIINNKNYKPGMPIVLVGTSSLPMYLPFRLDLNNRKSIHTSALGSIYEYPLGLQHWA